MKTKFDEKSQIVDLYGNDHSSWVQSVLLCLYNKNICCNLRTIPTLSLFFKSVGYDACNETQINCSIN